MEDIVIKATEYHEVHVFKEMVITQETKEEMCKQFSEDEVNKALENLQVAIDERNEEAIFDIISEYEIDFFCDWEEVDQDWFSDRKGGYQVDINFDD